MDSGGWEFILKGLSRPWSLDRPAIYDQIVDASSRQSKYETLELNLKADENSQLRWAPGAFDAMFGGVIKPSAKLVTARSLLAALGKLMRRPSPESFDHFYRQISEPAALSEIDAFLHLVDPSKFDPSGVAAVARMIATQSPDIGAIKYALGLLGVCAGAEDCDLIAKLGAYEEFTLFAVPALSNILDDPEEWIWRLAQKTYLWGRVESVSALKGAKDPRIRRWLLVEGYDAGPLTEEIAYICATEGRLLSALRETNPSEELLDGVGDILGSLIDNPVAEGIDDYQDGAEAMALYVSLVNARPSKNIKRFYQIDTISRFELNTTAPWLDREKRGWSASRRWEIRTNAAAFLRRPEWPGLVDQALVHGSNYEVWIAGKVAKSLNIDCWRHFLRRQKENRSNEWFNLMQTNAPERIEQIISLAIEQLDLDLVGSGPTLSWGLGPGYEDDRALDAILQDLHRFPGQGWSLIEIGLRGRTTRARSMALKAISGWERDQWPEDAHLHLRSALQKEPNEEIAERIQSVILGKPLD